MLYGINSNKLKYIITIERGLQIKRVSRGCMCKDDYLYKAFKRGKLPDNVIERLNDRYEINPARYVIGWKGGKEV